MKSIFTVVGMRYRGTEQLLKTLEPGEPLTLVRDPTNKFDSNAIKVEARGQFLGFIKATQNSELAWRMDRDRTEVVGKLVVGNWPQVEIEEE